MEGVDFISNLPDVLLADIVSVLPGTEGVRTCVLSHRWKTVWKNSTHLNFNQRKMLKSLIEIDPCETNPNMGLSKVKRSKMTQRDEKIMDEIAEAALLINSVIGDHLGPLKSCKIQHLPESMGGHIEEWMRNLLEKGVRDISMERDPHYVVNKFDHQNFRLRRRMNISYMLYLPFEVISGFEVLKLKNYNLKILPSENLPQVLKTLTLNDVSMRQTCFQEIISHCSALENLTLQECHIISGIKVESPSLKFFKIYNMHVPEISICAINLEAIEINTVYCNVNKLVLQTPKLQVLHSYYDLEKGVNHVSPSADKLLTTKEIVEVCSGNLSPQGSRTRSVFENLITLSINLDLKNIRNGMVLSLALKSCHVLKNLEINNQVDDGTVYNQNEDYYLPFPEHTFWRNELSKCMYHSLRTLSIRAFTGKVFEVEFVKYIITNEENMEKITIWFLDDSKWSEAIATSCLLSFPKASVQLAITLKPGTKYMEEFDGSFEKWVGTLKD